LNLPTATIQQQQQEAQHQYTFSPIIGQYERLNKHAKNYLIQQASPSVLSATLNQSHKYQPRKVRWKRLAELTALNTDILKEPVEDYIPDVTSHSTVLALALMTSNAYIEADNTTDWYDLGEPWQLVSQRMNASTC
jgi:lipase ATG15